LDELPPTTVTEGIFFNIPNRTCRPHNMMYYLSR
jgi:hypothetical protein